MSTFGKPGTTFKKSSFSGAGNANCVEVGMVITEVRLRDSKDPNSPVLCFTTSEWAAFIAGVKAEEFELD